jgi:hypothetical protein
MDIDIPKALDVHGISAYKIADEPLNLSGTAQVCAAHICSVIFPVGKMAARRANIGDLKDLCPWRALVRYLTYALRNHFP